MTRQFKISFRPVGAMMFFTTASKVPVAALLFSIVRFALGRVSYRDYFLRNIMSLICSVNNIGICTVIAGFTLVINRLNRYTIRAVHLLAALCQIKSSCPLARLPRWDKNLFNTQWCNNISNHCIKVPVTLLLFSIEKLALGFRTSVS